ncbi:hypothetical protein M501DRAFT_932102 [Patellaria atrata CBS 101060]|uniref:Histone-lysine N-methyltransferase, H3 lysine-36 specific n=1 Tax=Patellaria atrata CBS 101060 TaxID=1346257 RepID=A0A9P4SCP2_9PEZI|nr:hypothetical protein M501DRAFT_932102 [Patellaria atrata CBS 101060]
MSDNEREEKSAQLEIEVREMKIEADTSEDGAGAVTTQRSQLEKARSNAPNNVTSPSKLKVKSSSHSPIKLECATPSPIDNTEEVIGGDIMVKLEPGKAPKLSRASSHKVMSRTPPLFLDLPDSTPEATRSFQVIDDCSYAAKYLGTTDHALECDCAEEWDPITKSNNACGEDSDCINRATKMECIGDCTCGTDCLNQRFQRKQYADVTVIKTEKKGYGLRANTPLRANDFIFEYIGEVINENTFHRRMRQYDEEGIKHFYFMSLSKGEFVDATKKGNLGRFCNHSCNPNCYVDKWVVGDKLRMGIFAERNVKAGEELVFNYNVDRYGADPQPCYCGEPNCTGFIGGKTQTDRATKLSHATIEALGIDDGDGWDIAVAKKPRKRKTGEDDEEYVNNVQPKSLDEGSVTKVMATLMQCREKWIAVKLLNRIQRADDERVRNRVVKMHGYQILKTTLNTWIEDYNVVSQVLDILDSLPRITRNKIQDSKIEETVEKLKTCGDEKVEGKASTLLEIWSKLEIGYRIPRVKRDPNVAAATDRFERREVRPRDRSKSRTRSRSRSVDAPRGPAAPAGPRSSMPQRNPNFFNGPRPPFRRPPFQQPLPPGWFAAQSNGQTYYYSGNNQVTWTRPTMPASQPPPPPPKAKTNEQKLQDIIKSITESQTPKDKPSASATPQSTEPKLEKKQGKEKWRSFPEEKQKKLYENTLFTHIKPIMDKYNNKMPKDDLKKFAKKITKKMVESDYKNKRVDDPTKMHEKGLKALKKYVRGYFDECLKGLRKEAEKKKAAEKAKGEISSSTPKASEVVKAPEEDDEKAKADSDDDMMNEISDDEESPTKNGTSPTGSPDLKRKREYEDANGESSLGDEDMSSPKKSRMDTPPPPPPPPPPTEGRPEDGDMNTFDTDEMTVDDGMTESYNEHGTDGSNPMQLATPPTNGSSEHDEALRRKDKELERLRMEQKSVQEISGQ